MIATPNLRKRVSSWRGRKFFNQICAVVMVITAHFLLPGDCHAKTAAALAHPKLKILLHKRGDQIRNRLFVEIANTQRERDRGLMGRRQMVSRYCNPNTKIPHECVEISLEDPLVIDGMWFEFDHDTKTCFWMKQTYLPLDLIFTDSQGKILQIEQSLRPYDRSPRCPQSPYRFALELKQGSVRELGIKVGDILHLK